MQDCYVIEARLSDRRDSDPATMAEALAALLPDGVEVERATGLAKGSGARLSFRVRTGAAGAVACVRVVEEAEPLAEVTQRFIHRG